MDLMKNIMMKMLRGITLAVILLLSASCTGEKKKDTPFEKYGISFVCPAGWSVTDAMDAQEAVYVAVEDDGEITGGVVTFTLFFERLDLGECLEFMNGYFDDAQEEFTMFEIGDVEDGVYNRFPAKVQEYMFGFDGMNAKGRFVAFNAGEYTVCILEQNYMDNYEGGRHAFEKLENTFAVDEYYR